MGTIDTIIDDGMSLNPFAIVIDSQEELPYAFHSIPTRCEHKTSHLVVPTIVAHLESGDYSIEGRENEISVERKSLGDLYGTLGSGRGRFEREIIRLQELQYAAVVIEADWREICRPMDPYLMERQAMEVLWVAAQNYAHSGSPTIQQAAQVSLELLMQLQMQFRNLHILNSEDRGATGWWSQLNPRSVWGTIFAWAQRYPKVHWFAMGSRRMGELATFEILERYWREREG